MHQILLTHPFLPDLVRQELKPHAKLTYARTRAELLKKLSHADALICTLSERIDAELLSKAPRLKAIANFAVGINNIDLAACRARGIRVTNTPDVLTRATAELALTLLLAAARRVPEGERLCRSGRFKGWDPVMLLGLELRDRHAVLVGRGRIGQETAKLFEAIGLKISWVTRQTSAQELQHRLKQAQVLSLHVPLTPDTRHWLNKSRIALLPPDAIIINTTRGPVVDERALIQALKRRKIFAAGLDVYEHEPEIPAELRKLPNCVLLPHLGSATQAAREGMARLAFRGALALLNGETPANEVNF